MCVLIKNIYSLFFQEKILLHVIIIWIKLDILYHYHFIPSGYLSNISNIKDLIYW